jgi:thymidylate kinase
VEKAKLMEQTVLMSGAEDMNLQRDLADRQTSVLESSDRSHGPVLHIVSNLCAALAEEHIDYCHWKSNNALARSMSGDNDLDLLINRTDMTRFIGILARFGFKGVKAPLGKQMQGVSDYFGYDRQARKLVHVHAHNQLVLGNDLTKNFRLPIEKPYLASAVQGPIFRVPSPEFEFIIFVVRMSLKHLTWDMVLTGSGNLRKSERDELQYLQAKVNMDRVSQLLHEWLPYIEIGSFGACVECLAPGASAWTRIKTGHQLVHNLQTDARRDLSTDTLVRLWRRMILAFQYRIGKPRSKYALESGGAMIAVVGSDGAGKSTAIDNLYALLTEHFSTTKVHMGKPTWSWTTRAVRAVLKTGQLIRLYPLEASFRETLEQKSLVSPGYPWLVREVCRARDRYHTYLGARRLASNGGLVILDRFPLAQIQLMDGPQTARFVLELGSSPRAAQFTAPLPKRRSTRFLIDQEEDFYQRIASPDLVIVLRVNPATALQRKPNDDPISVRERATEICQIDWTEMDVHVIDGEKSKDEVASQLESLVWSGL